MSDGSQQRTSGFCIYIDTFFQGPVPTVLVAVTTKVYAVPFVRPLTVQLSVPPVMHCFAPGALVTWYPLIGLPPIDVGALHDTMAEALPEVAEAHADDRGRGRRVARDRPLDVAPAPLGVGEERVVGVAVERLAADRTPRRPLRRSRPEQNARLVRDLPRLARLAEQEG